MNALPKTEAVTPTFLIASLTILAVVYLAGRAVYDAYLGPLSHIPGPRLNAITFIPHVRHLLKGTMVQNTVALHKKYGPVVRLSPHEVSFTSATTAYSEIYGFRTGKLKGHLNMQKDRAFYSKNPSGVPSLIMANDEDHARGRKVLSHAFSEKSLNAQEPLIQDYVDQLVTRLKEITAADDAAVDLVKWYNWTTFDVIADLMFGEPFGCLQNLATHKYVKLLFEMLESTVLTTVLGYLPWLKLFGNLAIDSKILKKRVEYADWVASQVQKRMGNEPNRPDFMSDILRNNGSKGVQLTQKEIDANSSLFITAGSETTATLLSGATYLLTRNPDKLRKLQNEVRGYFKSYDEITLEAVNHLPYLIATLTESLRVFPPVPVGFPRETNKGGEIISGHYIPENTGVSVSQFATNHSEENFRDAEAFVPERWLATPVTEEDQRLNKRYENDQKACLQPFNIGPRACLGRNLANAEMRLIVAKMVWTFDMQLEERSQDWLDRCTVTRLWVKPELAVRLTLAQRT